MGVTPSGKQDYYRYSTGLFLKKVTTYRDNQVIENTTGFFFSPHMFFSPMYFVSKYKPNMDILGSNVMSSNLTYEENITVYRRLNAEFE